MIENVRRAFRLYKVGNVGSLMRLASARLSLPRSERASGREVAEPWSVDQVVIERDRVTVRGWTLPPNGVVEPREFRVNGRRCEFAQTGLLCPAVGAAFPLRPHAEQSGFECRALHPEHPYPGGVLEIERVRPGAEPVERGRDSWFVPDPALHVDLPDEDRRYRVIGNRDPAGFLTTGATDYHRLDRAVAAIAGRRMRDFRHVLDWGAGCGRVARHFPAQCAAAFTGCDIDHDNVNWCRAHLPGAFVRSAIDPPLPFPTGKFDLVYGVSVFTHFREALQRKWLDELARVTSRDALLLLTVHGTTALEFARLSPDDHARLRKEIERAGLLVTGTNSQIDGFADHRGEYVNVFHSHDYIRSTWSRHFDVAALIPGYIFTHDLVVLRKR